jgi:hypothetical protein
VEAMRSLALGGDVTNHAHRRDGAPETRDFGHKGVDLSSGDRVVSFARAPVSLRPGTAAPVRKITLTLTT